MSTEVTVGGVGEGEEVIPVIYHPTVLMNRSNDTAPFNPSNNHLYCYPLVLSTLRYSVGMMHSNCGTLGEIVSRTCAHRAFYEKEQNLGGLGRRKFT